MELRDFVTQTILQIIAGVEAAQRDVTAPGALVAPRHEELNTSWSMARNEVHPTQTIEFDVAVTTGSVIEGQGGVKVEVATLFSAGGGGAASQSHERVSRVRFTVPITLPASSKGKKS